MEEHEKFRICKNRMQWKKQRNNSNPLPNERCQGIEATQANPYFYLFCLCLVNIKSRKGGRLTAHCSQAALRVPKIHILLCQWDWIQFLFKSETSDWINIYWFHRSFCNTNYRQGFYSLSSQRRGICYQYFYSRTSPMIIPIRFMCVTP